MDFTFKEEQQQFADALRRWIDKDYSFEARRKIVQGGVRINGEKASLGVAVPAEDYLLQAGKLGAVRVVRKSRG